MQQIERSNYDKAQGLKENINRHVNYPPDMMRLPTVEIILKAAIIPLDFLRTFSKLRNFKRFFINLKACFFLAQVIDIIVILLTDLSSTWQHYLDQELTHSSFPKASMFLYPSICNLLLGTLVILLYYFVYYFTLSLAGLE